MKKDFTAPEISVKLFREEEVMTAENQTNISAIPQTNQEQSVEWIFRQAADRAVTVIQFNK